MLRGSTSLSEAGPKALSPCANCTDPVD